MSRFRLSFGWPARLYAASFAAVAAGADTRKPLEVATVVAQQQQIRDDLLARKGRYKDMPDPACVELLSKQAELLTPPTSRKGSRCEHSTRWNGSRRRSTMPTTSG